MILSAHGIPAITYSSAEAFLEHASWTLPGCLILDLRMPGIGGERLLSILHERGDLPPIIVLTAHGSIDSAVRTIKQGAVEFMEKPCATEELLRKVREAIASDVERLHLLKARQDLRARLSELTAREHSILDGVVRGLSSAEIADELGLQPKSVEVYRGRVLAKMGYQSSIELVRVLLMTLPKDWASTEIEAQ